MPHQIKIIKMKLEELDNWTIEDLEEDISKGGKFVIFTYTISVVLMTFRRPSDLYYIKSDEYSISHGWCYFLLSLLLGWWGVPWGPIYTIQSLWYAFTGKDVTEEVKYDIMQHMQVGNYVYDTDKIMNA